MTSSSTLAPLETRDDTCDDTRDEPAGDAPVDTLAALVQRTGEQATQLVDHATTVLCLTSVMGTQLVDVNARATGVAARAGDIAARSRDAAAATAEIRALVDEARAAVQELGASARDIARISNTLQRMALETRMVGLNAAIEAARAGAAGAGFAVVAEKVRELADGANAASEQIIARLTAIRDHAVQSAVVMERVGTNVGLVDAHAVDIAAAAAQQESGMAEIALGVSGISAAVEEIVRHVEDVTETGMALSTGAGAGVDAVDALRALRALA
ncbi:MAG: methyl-accepting chemotaxis protein [Gemmatirosa sp.]